MVIIFIYPSFYKGFGLCPPEAIQCGASGITSNTALLPEVAGDTSTMVASADVDALCDAMLSVFQNPQLHKPMVKPLLNKTKQYN